MRLGLSDSMRSTASLGDLGPLHASTHCPIPPQQHSAIIAQIPRKQKTTLRSILFVLSNPLWVIVGSVLAVMLLSPGSNTLQIVEQLDELERGISLVYRDTVRLETAADRFLQHCQKTHVAAFTRKKMLQTVSIRSVDEKVAIQTEKHAQITNQALQYYAEQKQKIKETRERLIQMNISLPLEIAVRPGHRVWQDVGKMIQDGGKLLENDDSRTRELPGALKGLFFAEKAQLQNESDFQHFSVDSTSFQTGGHLERSNRQQSFSHGSMFFYVFVACASAVYLWNAISDTRKKELLKDKWSWSPVPKAFRRLKRLLGSVVVIALKNAG